MKQYKRLRQQKLTNHGKKAHLFVLVGLSTSVSGRKRCALFVCLLLIKMQVGQKTDACIFEKRS